MEVKGWAGVRVQSWRQQQRQNKYIAKQEILLHRMGEDTPNVCQPPVAPPLKKLWLPPPACSSFFSYHPLQAAVLFCFPFLNSISFLSCKCIGLSLLPFPLYSSFSLTNLASKKNCASSCQRKRKCNQKQHCSCSDSGSKYTSRNKSCLAKG